MEIEKYLPSSNSSKMVREDWNEYKLLDGGRVRIKTTGARIFRVVDENGNQQYNDQGEPELVVRHKSDIVASIEQG